ncbi:MAG TPA: YetF domain-containing protein [Pyrinomonadaceae bacterium]
MDWLLRVDWRKAFVPELSVAEIFLRGTAVYFLLFAFLRILRRESGAIGITDLLVVVLIADAAQNAMAGEYVSITEGALLVGTIAFWDYTLDWLGYHSPAVARLLRPAPLALVKNGRMLRRNMRRELITEEELMSQLRQQGVGQLSEVARACLEGDGRISVLKREPGAESGGGSGGGGQKGSVPGH